MSTTATKAFQNAVKPSEIETSSTNYWQKGLRTSWMWSILTGIVVFVFLYCLNPPIVQKTQSGDELVKPGPNVSLVFLYSFIAALVVGLGPWISQKLTAGTS